jgi:hypothetical protein
MNFGSSNGWSGLTVSSWQIWLIVALCLVGIGTIAYWPVMFLVHHIRWIN